MAKLAHETGLSQEDLEQFYYFENGQPHLNGPVRKLGSNKAGQTRTVALGLVGAYFYALDRQELSVEEIRKECERLKCYDQPNFSTTLGGVAGTTYTGAARKKVLKPKTDSFIKALEATLQSYLGPKE